MIDELIIIIGDTFKNRKKIIKALTLMKEYVKDNYYYFIIFTLIIWLGYKYLLVVFILLILTITIVNIINSYPDKLI